VAAPAFSVRFIRSTGVSTPAYLVPANMVAVVRQLTFVGAGLGAIGAAAYGSFASPSEAFFQGVSGANSLLEWQGRVVVQAGEEFHMSCSSSCAMTAHGYLLTA
jgi:hypothetical protein